MPGRAISSGAAALILLCFFLPWVTVSCGEQEIATFNGYTLAAGGEVDVGGMGSQEVDGDPLLFTIPVAALVSVLLLMAASQRRLTPTAAAVGQALTAAGAAAILWLKWTAMESEAAEGGMGVSIEFGLWAVILGLAGLLVGAVLLLNEKPGAAGGADVSDWQSATTHDAW